MTDAAPASRRVAVALAVLLAAFVLRVLGQALVALLGVEWLPPMREWMSGLLPYPWLLAAQVLLIALFSKVCADLWRGRGFFARTRPGFGRGVLWFGYVYFAGMILRYALRMWLVPEARWLGQTIPIFFHLAIATGVILFGRHHRARLRAHPSP